MTDDRDYEIKEFTLEIKDIRQQPKEFIQSTDIIGLYIILTTIVDNSIKEVIAGSCNKIEIILDRDRSFTVIDNSQGIPVDINSQTKKSVLEKRLTSLDVYGFYWNEEKYRIIKKQHHTDIAITNALSEWLEVTVWQNNKTYYQRYEKGKPVTKLQEKPDRNNLTGTKISFKPDPEIFTEYSFNIPTLKMRLQELAYLNKGLNIILKNFTRSQEKITNYHYPQGMKDYLSQINKNKTIINEEVIYLQERQGDILVEVALQWYRDKSEEYYLYSLPQTLFYKTWVNSYFEKDRSKVYDTLHLLGFVNQVYTVYGGSHIEGVKQGIIQAMNNYIDPEKNLNWIKLSSGLTGIVSLILDEEKYNSGLTKWKLENPEITDIVSNLVSSTLTKYFQRYPQVATEILSNC